MVTRTEDDLPTVFLHIGTPKSGTTYLQSRMVTNHRQAADQGLMWPGPRWGVQVEAVRELRGLEAGERFDPKGPWMRLVKSTHAWSGPRALISMEWMSFCTDTQVKAAVESLAPARVEVICTTRDLLRMFVAQWQEMTKNCRPWSWQQFVDEMVGDTPGAASKRFWAQQDVPMILTRWAKEVPWDRFHLVTVPPQGSDPETLWNRFCSVLSVDGTAFEQPPKNNESIGVVSASLMHRVNLVAIQQEMDRLDYQRVMHRLLADKVLAPRRSREASFGVSAEVDAWVRARAVDHVEEIRALDLHVVGELEDLLPGPPLDGREPSDVSDSEMLDICVEAMVTMAMAQDEANRSLRRANRGLRKRVGLRRRSSSSATKKAPKAPKGSEPTARRLSRKARRLARKTRSRVSGIIGH